MRRCWTLARDVDRTCVVVPSLSLHFPSLPLSIPWKFAWAPALPAPLPLSFSLDFCQPPVFSYLGILSFFFLRFVRPCCSDLSTRIIIILRRWFFGSFFLIPLPSPPYPLFSLSYTFILQCPCLPIYLLSTPTLYNPHLTKILYSKHLPPIHPLITIIHYDYPSS